MKTAAIIIIGNEILTGRVEDSNSLYLARELRALGVDLRRISVVPDDIEAIAEETAHCSSRFDLVFTSGGVGPTHDDVTMEGIARAFGLKTVGSEVLSEYLQIRCGGPLNEALSKMTCVPEGAELIQDDKMGFPAVVFRNIYIFPGIPEYLVKKFTELKYKFKTSRPYLIRKVFISGEECDIAEALTRVSDSYADVSIGSYPKVGDEPADYKVTVTLESKDEARLNNAFNALMRLLEPSSVVRTE